ncbi:MAG: hypothetical protein K0S74_693 [Chlamydiales bacterium]|jgi:esterase FrsA|nr:hypothetical protein [Chlamydiales bacterium]
MSTNSIKVITTDSDHRIHYIGPDLSHGPLPALIYFALSGEDSLSLDPYNQPVDFMLKQSEIPFRVFSWTLPGHEGHLPLDREALQSWVDEFLNGKKVVAEFLSQVQQDIKLLYKKGYILDSFPIAAMGLSRGGWIATHLAANCKSISYLLTFAPITDLSKVAGLNFPSEIPKIYRPSFALTSIINELMHVTIRFYIGNCDERVSTSSCYEFIKGMAGHLYTQGIRSPPVELCITPSIGFKGHGTSPITFKEGVKWLYMNWLLKYRDRGI